MNWIINILALLIAYIFMEFAAWSMHKYVMHGFMWKIHKDHHIKDHPGKLERNDLFFIVFALPAILLIYIGYEGGALNLPFWFGLGISLYGISYVFVHDIFIHQRIKLFRNADSAYFKAMRRAHKIHHKHIQKENSESFGFLWVPKKYFNPSYSGK